MGGTKYWWLLPPDALTEADGLKPESSTPQNCYGINPYEGNGKNMKWLLAVVHPGNVMVVPPGWWHYVESFGPNLSINTWYNEDEIASLNLGGPADTARNGEMTVDLTSASAAPSPLQPAQTPTIAPESRSKTPTQSDTTLTHSILLSTPHSPGSARRTSTSPNVHSEGLRETLQGLDSEPYSGHQRSPAAASSTPAHGRFRRRPVSDRTCRELEYAPSHSQNTPDRRSTAHNHEAISDNADESLSPPLSRNVSQPPSPRSHASARGGGRALQARSGASPMPATSPLLPDNALSSLDTLRAQVAALTRQVELMTKKKVPQSSSQSCPKTPRVQQSTQAEGRTRPVQGTDAVAGPRAEGRTRPVQGTDAVAGHRSSTGLVLPSHLARFRSLRGPPTTAPRAGFRFTIPASVDVMDLGMNSAVKDACWQLRGAAKRKLTAPSAPPDSLLHVACSAHGHMKANDSKSHLQDSVNIKNIHMDLNKIDRHVNIARVAKPVADKMLKKWKRTYREPDFAEIMKLYFTRAGPTPRAVANLINIEGEAILLPTTDVSVE